MIQNLVRFALLSLLFLAQTACPSVADTLALVGATVYPSATAAPIRDAVVVASDGVITATGPRNDVQVPKDARVIDCTGKAIVAGFWNSHVHFTEPVWNNAAGGPAAPLEKHMQDMLTSWGFTTVWDIGSNPANSVPLRRRIEAGEVRGLRILLVGSLFPKGGHPVYLPPEAQLPMAATPEEAARMTGGYMQMGADGLKLFTGSFMGAKPVVNMDAAIAKAATDVAHAQGKFVFAHPQNRAGVDAVLAARVNVLAHTIPTEPGYTPEQLSLFRSQGTALVPTLALWTNVVRDPAITERLVASGVAQLKAFAANGGAVLFGTDVGFTQLYDTTLELEFMRRALPAGEVLASLTTGPASYFKAAKKGRVETGFDADLAVIEGDPIADVRNLAKVAYTIRAGRIIYQKP
jgi:imidazolonepropionase-like amidohydrolase